MADTDSLSDEDIFARTLDGEAGGEGLRGRWAVANVVINRTQLHWQGSRSFREVCLRYEQFSCWNGNNQTNRDRARIMSANETQSLVYKQCLDLARLAMEGRLEDMTGGADSYEVSGTAAYWAKGLTPSAIIGKHSFYITRADNRPIPPLGSPRET